MSKIFISFNSKDLDVATRFQTFFIRTFGWYSHDVFMSETSLQGGKRVESDILSALKSSDFLIFILSHNYFESPYCLCELGAAWALDKNKLIYLLQPLSFQDDKYRSLPASIQDTQALIIKEGDKSKIIEHLEKLVEQISLKENEVRRLTYYNDRLIDLAEYLSEPNLIIKRIPIHDAFLFHNPFGTTNTLKQEKRKDKLLLRFDFSHIKPNFSGCAICINNEDWTGYYKADYKLYFTISSTEQLEHINFELKDERDKIEREPQIIFLSSVPVQHKIRLSDLGALERFKKIREITFVKSSVDFQATATVEISNIFLAE